MRINRYILALAVLGVVGCGARSATPASVRGHIPANVRARVLKEAQKSALWAGYASEIEAVLTTAGRTPNYASEKRKLLPASTPVYFIAMRGRFPGVCQEHMARRRLEACEYGSFVAAEIPAEILQQVRSIPWGSPRLEAIGVHSWAAPTKRFPNLKAMGTPVCLSGCKT